VGIGRKAAASPAPHTDVAYQLCWCERIACAERADAAAERATNADEARHRELGRGESEMREQVDDAAARRLATYVNCALFDALGDERRERALPYALRVFLCARPLAAVAQSDALQRAAQQALGGDDDDDDFDSATAWRPTHFDALPDDIEHYRVYRTLVWRVALLRQLIDEASAAAAAAAATERDERARREALEYRLHEWRDAHILLALAFDELGYVPRDDSAAAAALLECYSPDVHTVFCEGELPDMARELGYCEFLAHRDSNGDALRREFPIVNLFTKALPLRADVRDMAQSAADLASSDSGAFGLVKLLLAASFLGVYRRAEYRPRWRMRYAVYKLFFFEPDARVTRHCRAKRASAAVALERDFSFNELVGAVQRAHSESGAAGGGAPPGGTGGRKAREPDRARERSARLTYVDFEALLEARFKAAKSELSRGTRDTSFAALRRRATRVREQRKERVAHSDASGALREARHVANAVARCAVEKARGEAYYRQLEALGALPRSGAPVARNTPPPVVPPPAPRGTHVDYRSAVLRRAPCDYAPTSRTQAARDALVFAWLTASTTQRTGAIDGDTAAGQRDYLFQDALALALRQFVLFGLQRWHEAVRHELFARVEWGAWERQVWRAHGSTLRALDAAYDTRPPCALGAFFANYAQHRLLARFERESVLRAHIESGRETFLDALLRLMQNEITENGFGSKPIDHVLPRETPLLLRHLLAYYRYPRFAPLLPPVHAAPVPAAPAAEGAGRVFEQYHERIVPAQLEYLIEPVGAHALPLGERVDGAWIERELVARARFPLAIFHASEHVLRRFAHVRTQYHLLPSDAVLDEFVEWLARQSPYQFYLLHAYARAVHQHLNIYSVPLPRHVAEHQLRSLRNYYCVPRGKPVPDKLLTALVCVDCQRCALTFVEPGQKHSSMATGNNSVRFVPRTDDDDVLEHLRERCFRPLPLAALRPAKSYTHVLQRRMRASARAYDRFVDEPADAYPCHNKSADDAPRLAPAQTAEEFARAVIAGEHDAAADTDGGRAAQQTDRRDALYANDAPFARRELGELRLVARGMGRLGELDFESAMWRETERRMRLFGDYGARASRYDAPNRRSFLLLGHSAENADARYDVVKWVDASKRQKSEDKKFKQHTTQDVRIGRIFDDKARASKQIKHDVQKRKDAFNVVKFAQCSRQQMLQVDLCGRALRADALSVSGKERRLANEAVLACTDCLAALRTRDARPIADRVVCDTCYRASQRVGGAVAVRHMSGAGKPRVARNALATLSVAHSRTTRSTERQLALSPSFAALCGDVIAEGTRCIRHHCLKVKSGPGTMVGLEVLKDTDVGNETYGYVYFCTKHAAAYAALFRLPTVIALSTLENFLLERKRNFDEVTASGTSFLDDVIRRAAHSSSIGSAARAREEHEIDERKEARERRNKQKRNAERRIKRRRANARERDLRAP